MKCRLLAIGLAACVQYEIEGTPDDVQTQPGAYDGFRFVRPCTQTSFQQAVIRDVGRGLPGLALDRELQETGHALYDDIHARVPSMFAPGGASIPCEGGSGGATWVQLWDWGDVDVTVQLVGNWLRDHDLALEVGIEVTAPSGM